MKKYVYRLPMSVIHVAHSVKFRSRGRQILGKGRWGAARPHTYSWIRHCREPLSFVMFRQHNNYKRYTSVLSVKVLCAGFSYTSVPRL